MSERLVRAGRNYAIVRCMSGCRLTFGHQEEQGEVDGADVPALRKLARDHAKATGHKTMCDVTVTDYYMTAEQYRQMQREGRAE